jgi:hypothetical protein
VETTVEMSRATLAALKRCGGNLFIWLDGAGMIHVRPRRPRHAVSFDTIETNAVVLHVDPQIKRPQRWVIVYSRLPWPHFDALLDPPESSGSVLGAIVDNITWP